MGAFQNTIELYRKYYKIILMSLFIKYITQGKQKIINRKTSKKLLELEVLGSVMDSILRKEWIFYLFANLYALKNAHYRIFF
jgi:hypothetical protein